MKRLSQIKHFPLAMFSAIVLTGAVAGAAFAIPCLIPTADCPPADCG